VQGESAPPKIVSAVEALDALGDVDLIIVARGGGSLEELWAFNDEQVARAIAGAGTPVICGVGHETDFSLADFAADVRAPTPSAAAEMAVPDRAELRVQVAELIAASAARLRGDLETRRWRLVELTRSLRLASPVSRLAQARQRLDDLASRAGSSLRHGLILRRERLVGLGRQLTGISPVSTLERGYAIVRRPECGAVVRSVRAVATGDALDIRVSDGEFGARVS
jgi:exodeoxyribonuclease VII large subunit